MKPGAAAQLNGRRREGKSCFDVGPRVGGRGPESSVNRDARCGAAAPRCAGFSHPSEISSSLWFIISTRAWSVLERAKRVPSSPQPGHRQGCAAPPEAVTVKHAVDGPYAAALSSDAYRLSCGTFAVFGPLAVISATR